MHPQHLTIALEPGPNIQVVYVGPNHNLPVTGEGNYTDFKRYIEYPTRFGKFDYVFVDGRARKDCIVKTHELLNEKGIVVLHDANRKAYHGPFKLYKHQVLYEDCRPWGGLWIGSKGMDIENVLDVDRHKKLWRIYNALYKCCCMGHLRHL